MQIGSTELLIILIIVIVVYGLYRVRPSSPTPSSSGEEKQGAEKGQADAGDQRFGGRTHAGAPNSSTGKDPYAILSIPRNATQDEVVAAYRKMAQMYHPDKVAGLAPEYHEIAESKMKDINAAYEQLRRKSKAQGAPAR
jgi:DnaJ-domain-containing protein 1